MNLFRETQTQELSPLYIFSNETKSGSTSIGFSSGVTQPQTFGEEFPPHPLRIVHSPRAYSLQISCHLVCWKKWNFTSPLHCLFPQVQVGALCQVSWVASRVPHTPFSYMQSDIQSPYLCRFVNLPTSFRRTNTLHPHSIPHPRTVKLYPSTKCLTVTTVKI